MTLSARKFLIYILINLLIYYSQEDITNVLNSSSTTYPYTLRLLNGNILLVINKGIYFLDPNLVVDSTRTISFETEIQSGTDFDKISFAQFSAADGAYIMVLVIDQIYFFSGEGDLIDDKKDLSGYLNSDAYSLVPYKKESNYLHYLISFKNGNHKFDIYQFKFDINSPYSNTKEMEKNVDSKVYSNGADPYLILGPSCYFLSISTYDHDVFVCSYAIFGPLEIQAKVFDPNNNFGEIEEYFKYSALEDASYFNSITNKDKRKLFNIILVGSTPYSLIYDFNSFSVPKRLTEEQNENKAFLNYKNRLVYFKETDEFIFVSNRWGNPPIPLIILNGDFSVKEYGDFNVAEGVYQINTACPLYDGEDYYLIYDNQNFIFYGKIGNLIRVEPEENETPEPEPIETTILETTILETTILETTILVTTLIETTLPTTLPSFTKDIKCKTATYESASYNLCTECNNDNGYYSAQYSDNSFLHGFLECYNIINKPSNLFYDSSLKIFKQCYMSCRTCSRAGNQNAHYCLECDDNYIKQPDIPDTTNCVIKCNYMYYYTAYGQYKCTTENKCPEEAKLYIEDLKKCTDDCSKEEIYKYKYSTKCLKNCPENTESNEENICIDINLNVCKKTESEFAEKKELDYNEIDLNAKIYAEDFSYTDKHVNYYYNNLYSILLYKDSYCIDELSLNMPKVDFGNCYSKVVDNLNPPTTDKIIIALVEKFNKDKKSSTTYFFYHPISGEKIDVQTICKDEEVVVKESVLSQLNNSNVDLDAALFLADQNIDIFNLSDAFYTDICFHFQSPNGKDIPLKDRVLTFYPNVTLCDEGCEIKGVNLTTMESICECKFSDLLSFGENALVQNALGGFTNLLSSSNIMVFKCYKDILDKKYFLKNTGGYIFIGIISAEIIVSILFFSIDMLKIFQYLYKLTEHYINSINPKKKSKSSKKDNYLTINSTENAPPKIAASNNYNEKKKKLKKSKSKNFVIISSNNDEPNTQKNSLHSFKKLKSQKLRNNLRENLQSEMDYFNYDEAIKDISPNIKSDQKSKNININIDMDEYLKPDLDDMEYDDAIKYDKRSFCLFYWERLKEKQLIINIFCNSEFLRPITMKFLLLLLNIDLYFVVNGLFYNEDYLSKLFHSTEKETFFSFFTRSIERFFYATIVGAIIESIIGFIFIEEKKIKKIYIRERENFAKLKFEIFKIIKSIKIRFILFIILCFIIAIISWYYINCFNNVYPGVKMEWIKSSLLIVIVVQLLPFILTFIEALLRIIGFKCKSEKIFELKKYLS